MNYLQLVNGAIQEAGVDLDDLTSSNFAVPTTTKMYKRFKTWVSDAWSDIQLEANDWEFQNGTAVFEISPVITIKNGSRSTVPSTGSTFLAANGTTFTVDSVSTSSGDWTLGTAEAVLTISDITGPFELLDLITEVTPIAGSGTFNFKYFTRYNLRDYVTDLEELKIPTMKIQVPNGNMRGLIFVPYAQWVEEYELDNTRGMPLLFTETPEGHFDFYPRPDTTYVISFEYTKGLNTLTNYDDTPDTLDSRYHPAIMWRAIMYYANYDKDPNLWSTAKKRHDFYLFTYDRDLGSKPSWSANQFDERS